MEGYNPIADRDSKETNNGEIDEEDPYRANGTYFNKFVSRRSFDLVRCAEETLNSWTEYYKKRYFDDLTDSLEDLRCVDTEQLYIYGEPNTRQEASVYIALEKAVNEDINDTSFEEMYEMKKLLD